MVRAILTWLLPFFFADVAWAFPETLRHGYPSCVSCHVAAGGGGVLTQYGRETGMTALSTWGRSRPVMPEWINAGVDYRRANVNLETDGVRYHRKFDMQLEGELALEPVKGLVVAGTVGLYGEEHRQEFRRAYGELRPMDELRVRAGRFLPAYGLNIDDHTDLARAATGLTQGRERIAVEAWTLLPYGELAISRTFGEDVEADATLSDGYTVKEEPREEVYARAVGYLYDRYRFGGSVRWRESQLSAVAGHVELAPLEWAWLQTEIGSAALADGTLYSSSKIGVEPYRGNHLFLTYEHQGDTQKYGGGYRWFPVYGVDLLVRAAATRAPSASLTKELTAILHLHL